MKETAIPLQRELKQIVKNTTPQPEKPKFPFKWVNWTGDLVTISPPAGKIWKLESVMIYHNVGVMVWVFLHIEGRMVADYLCTDNGVSANAATWYVNGAISIPYWSTAYMSGTNLGNGTVLRFREYDVSEYI